MSSRDTAFSTWTRQPNRLPANERAPMRDRRRARNSAARARRTSRPRARRCSSTRSETPAFGNGRATGRRNRRTGCGVLFQRVPMRLVMVNAARGRRRREPGRPLSGGKIKWASVGCRFPLDGFIRSAQRAPSGGTCFHADRPSDNSKNAATLCTWKSQKPFALRSYRLRCAASGSRFNNGSKSCRAPSHVRKRKVRG